MRSLGAKGPVARFLNEKSDRSTRARYIEDLCDFFGEAPTPRLVCVLLVLPDEEVRGRLKAYEERLLVRGQSPLRARYAARVVVNLLRFCRRTGYPALLPLEPRVKPQPSAQPFTREPTPQERMLTREQLDQLLRLPSVTTVKGRRDRAMLLLICENALSGEELRQLDVSDFMPEERGLVVGRSQGNAGTPIWLSPRCTITIATYLRMAGHADDGHVALFRHGPAGRRFAVGEMERFTIGYGGLLGLSGALTLSRVRNSLLAVALEAADGDLHRVPCLGDRIGADVCDRPEEEKGHRLSSHTPNYG